MPAGPVRRARGGLLPALAGLVACVGLAGCTGADDSSGPPPSAASTPAEEGTPLAEVDTSSLVVRRAPFCDAVDPGAVARALGVDADRVPGVTSYDNGQRTQLSPGVTDVAHEYGCTWKSGGAGARAWVFAPPVTPSRAKVLARAAGAEPGCAPVVDGAAYGRPGVAIACRADGPLRLSYRGLFGDAWLACSLVSPDAERTGIADAAGRWCAAVAGAAS
jgi:hypothetical protein